MGDGGHAVVSQSNHPTHCGDARRGIERLCQLHPEEIIAIVQSDLPSEGRVAEYVGPTDAWLFAPSNPQAPMS